MQGLKKDQFLWIIEILLWLLSQYNSLIWFSLLRQLENKIDLLTWPNLPPIKDNFKFFWWDCFPLEKVQADLRRTVLCVQVKKAYTFLQKYTKIVWLSDSN